MKFPNVAKFLKESLENVYTLRRGADANKTDEKEVAVTQPV